MTTLSTPVEIGAAAPDFSLRDQNNEIFVLSERLADSAVLVVFYPFAFTSICTGELTAVRDEPAVFNGAAVRTVSISCDSVYSHKIFDERDGFGFSLLSDFWPHGEVARSYGVFNDELGCANRGTFLVAPDGTVRFSEMNGVGRGRDPKRWREAIAALD